MAVPKFTLFFNAKLFKFVINKVSIHMSHSLDLFFEKLSTLPALITLLIFNCFCDNQLRMLNFGLLIDVILRQLHVIGKLHHGVRGNVGFVYLLKHQLLPCELFVRLSHSIHFFHLLPLQLSHIWRGEVFVRNRNRMIHNNKVILIIQ